MLHLLPFLIFPKHHSKEYQNKLHSGVLQHLVCLVLLETELLFLLQEHLCAKKEE